MPALLIRISMVPLIFMISSKAELTESSFDTSNFYLCAFPPEFFIEFTTSSAFSSDEE